jgi:hypothetical protein
MELHHLETAIESCLNGDLRFSNGQNTLCFLFKNTWFPIVPIVRKAIELGNGQNQTKLTPREALHQLFTVLPYVRYEAKNIENNILPNLNDLGRIEEIKILNNLINEIVN